MGNAFAHGTWIILHNNTPYEVQTAVSDFRFEEWGDWADRVDHKCDKRVIGARGCMEEFLRIGRGVKANKWTLTLNFSDGTWLALRIDQRYVNMKVRHWQWVEGLNHPPFIQGGDEHLYTVDYRINWEMWKIIIIISRMDEQEENTSNEPDIRARAIEAETKDIRIYYFAEAEGLKAKKTTEDIMKIKRRRRAEKKTREEAERKQRDEEKKESRMKVKEAKEGRNWQFIRETAHMLRCYPLANYISFIILMYLYFFIVMFYFSLTINASQYSVEA